MTEPAKRLTEEIDAFQPQPFARERMRARIDEKAAKKRGFPRWIVPAAAGLAAAALIMAFALPRAFAPSGEAPDDGPTAEDVIIVDGGPPMAGPPDGSAVLQYEEMDKGSLAARLGVALDAPKGAQGEKYALIAGTIGEAVFDLEGHGYLLRASEQAQGEALSGLYGEETERRALSGEPEGELVTLADGEETYRLIYWHEGGYHFVLANTDGAAEEKLIAVCRQIH